ncbi:MAG: MBL fold metallo-hydrolase [bacterium]|nr:MBL fold metallo-hydrolase [bacterium]
MSLQTINERLEYIDLEQYLPPSARANLWLGAFVVDKWFAQYIVGTRLSVLAVDSGWDESVTSQIISFALREFERRGWTPRLWYVLNTHSDWDHAWANRAFLAYPTVGNLVKTVASGETIKKLQSDLENDRISQIRDFHSILPNEPDYFEHSHIIVPQLAFSTDMELSLGQTKVTLISSTAHARGQLILHLPAEQILLAADALETPLPFLESPFNFGEAMRGWQYLQTLPIKHIGLAHSLTWSESTGEFDFSTQALEANLNYFKILKKQVHEHFQHFHKTIQTWIERESTFWQESLTQDQAWLALEGKPVEALQQLEQYEKITGAFNDSLEWFYLRAHHLAYIGAWLEALNDPK